VVLYEDFFFVFLASGVVAAVVDEVAGVEVELLGDAALAELEAAPVCEEEFIKDDDDDDAGVVAEGVAGLVELAVASLVTDAIVVLFDI